MENSTTYHITLLQKTEPVEGGGFRGVSKFKWLLKDGQDGPEFNSKEEALKYIEDNPLDYKYHINL